MRFPSRRIAWCTVLAALACVEAHAVRLDPDGHGQALVFPYYTAQSASGSALNTLISVVNHGADAKAVRVRFREGRNGAATLGFNLFLSPNDMWTGAVVPFGDGTRLLSVDRSCTDPSFAIEFAPGSPPFMDFRTDAFSGPNDDGAGAGADRTREGFVEMIEMATLTGTSAAAVTQTIAGVPDYCIAVRAPAAVSTAAPSGGLAGTLTVINVASGMSFALSAEPLADLSTRPFYRPAGDPYPDFDAAEIEPVSSVVDHGRLYRSEWSRPADAVSAVLMRSSLAGEFVLDAATRSNTDFIVTFPTRRFYVDSRSAMAPFSHAARWDPKCGADASNGEDATVFWYDREHLAYSLAIDFNEVPQPVKTVCAASVVFDLSNGSPHTAPTTATHVLGSLTRGFAQGTLAVARVENGWLRMTFPGNPQATNTLVSLPSSTRVDLSTGTATTGPHTFVGLPLSGFAVRTFTNGALSCGGATCQGNYGAAFPFQYRRRITP